MLEKEILIVLSFNWRWHERRLIDQGNGWKTSDDGKGKGPWRYHVTATSIWFVEPVRCSRSLIYSSINTTSSIHRRQRIKGVRYDTIDGRRDIYMMYTECMSFCPLLLSWQSLNAGTSIIPPANMSSYTVPIFVLHTIRLG